MRIPARKVKRFGVFALAWPACPQSRPGAIQGDMLSIDEARGRILARLGPLPAEIVALGESWGRVCASPLAARLHNPPAPHRRRTERRSSVWSANRRPGIRSPAGSGLANACGCSPAA
jgi:hypothetical protein